MSDVIYAIKMYDVTYPGIQIMDVKIGKTTDIKRTKRQYRRGNREIEVLDLWQPNPQKNLSTGEKGVHDVAEKYAYERESEKFVFLQGKYQQFSETVDKLLLKTTEGEAEDAEPTDEPTGDVGHTGDDLAGTTPAAIEILDSTKDVDNWTDTLQTAAAQVLDRVENQDKITEIDGRERSYFVEKGAESNLISPREIPGTNMFVETNFSANDVDRLIAKILNKYGYDRSNYRIFTEEEA
ncbi:hypothetical protein [Haloquadratum walsbyi]|uniref:Uncharacterized protein n=1 Tax=Haloquadratum walsbyi (strain DSM 16790 / HBSQ001) TaxID=362976 RepID=Q18F88_HALWD|nr:hypothetical protein [Haloquadratum walsbyi]CAJ53370.1 uncharacterized protein HQ_3273A [Haloquadratum walsbyi DSM 16790]